jgi:hypothetical protein
MWTFQTDRDEHLDEHNQYDHADLAVLTNGKVLGVSAGIIKQIDALLLTGGSMLGNLDMGGFDVNNVQLLLGPAGSHIQMQPAAGFEAQIRDNAGIARFRVLDNGDIILADTAGAAKMWWDQSNGLIKIETGLSLVTGGTLDMNTGQLWDVGTISAVDTTLQLRAISSGAARGTFQLNVDDPTGVERLRMRFLNGDIFLFKEDGVTSVLHWDESLDKLILSTPLDMSANQIVDLAQPTLDQDAATKKYVDDNAGGGGAGLDVTRLTSDTILTASGVYVVDTSVGNRTITLPILSGTPTAGYRIKVIRDGANFVYLETNAADDYWDATTQRTLIDDFAASSVAVDDAATSWYELGRWRTVT